MLGFCLLQMNTNLAKGKKVLGLLKTTFNDWMEDKALRLSAAMAYYAVFSIAPLLVIAIGIAGLALGPEAVGGKLDDQLKTYIGAEAAEGVQSMVKSASKPSQGWMAAALGFATLLLGASGVFGQLKDALNSIWEVKPRSGGGIGAFVRERLLSFGMVLVIGFLLLTSLLLSSLIAGFSAYLERMVPLPAAVWGVLTFLISFGIVTTLFAFIFKVLPDAEVEWQDVWVGAAVTALLFEIGKAGLGYYLGKEAASSSYGAATSIVLLLLWVYYTSCILFFGAEFTQVYAKDRGRVIRPAANADALATLERAQQGMPGKECPVTLPPEPRREVLPRPELVLLPAPPAPQHNPLGGLLAVTGASMVVGLITRGWMEKTKRPTEQLKEGLAGIGREASNAVVTAFDRARKEVKRRTS
jgi:membrane protein